MTARENTWLRQDESQQQRVAAVRADVVTRFLFTSYDDREHFTVAYDSRSVWLGSCRPEDRAVMVAGFLDMLRRAERSTAAFVVIEAVPFPDVDDIDGAVTLWRLHEDAWPGAGRVLAGATR